MTSFDRYDVARWLRTLWRIIIRKNSTDGITSIFTRIDKKLDVLQNDMMLREDAIRTRVERLAKVASAAKHESDKAYQFGKNLRKLYQGD